MCGGAHQASTNVVVSQRSQLLPLSPSARACTTTTTFGSCRSWRYWEAAPRSALLRQRTCSGANLLGNVKDTELRTSINPVIAIDRIEKLVGKAVEFARIM